EIQTSLFPTVVGEVEIEPSAIKTPGSFFQDGSYLQTRPIALDVQPLPPDAPLGFMGAVGQFEIRSEVDKTTTQVNDPVTMSVLLAGRGNLETAPDPAWTEGPEWRAFDSEAAVESWVEDGQRIGTRTYERTLVPTTPGDLTIPPVEYIYFNPQTGAYETARTEAVTIRVAPVAGAAPDSSADDDPGTTIGRAAPEALDQLMPNMEGLRTGNGGRSPLPEQPAYWLLWTLPVIFLVGQFAWQTGKKRRSANPAARRSQAAAGKARQALRSARREADGGAARVGPILRSYLEDKFNQPLAGLTENNLSLLLTEKGLEPGLVERVITCLHQSEISRFAPEDPTGEASRELSAEAGRLIDALEMSLS
ncbi:MAG: BatD family protein, partial [Anaerolineales bacterium]|nr:BatD family protein [Anaerolineales bacterium]